MKGIPRSYKNVYRALQFIDIEHRANPVSPEVRKAGKVSAPFIRQIFRLKEQYMRRENILEVLDLAYCCPKKSFRA